MLLDSNILIYASMMQNQEAITEIAMGVSEQKDACISAISCLEVLGYHKLEESEKASLEKILQRMSVFAVSDSVIEQAIALRQCKSMSLGDAIIAATALIYGQVLCTRNTDDFKWIDGLKLVNPFEG